MTRTHWAIAAAGALCLHAATLAASPTIAQIAPPDAIAVIGVDNFTNMRQAFDASFLGSLWDDPEMQAWVDKLLDDGELADNFAASGLGELLDKALDRAGMERGDLSTPAGAAGAALWWDSDAGPDDTSARWVAFCDFGDAGEDMRSVTESMIEVVGEEDAYTVTDDDYEGADVWLIESVDDNDGAADDGGPQDDQDFDQENPDETPIDRLLVGWINDTIIIAGDRSALERAINRINGDEMDTLADGARFASAMRQIDGAEFYAAGFFEPMLDAWLPDEAMMGFSLDPMLDALGLLDVDSVSMGARFDGPGGAFEQTFGLVAPEKKGLIALWDNKIDSFTPPSLVSADASKVFMLSFDWAGVMPLANQVINAIPDEQQRVQAQMSLGFLAGGVGPLLEGMRSEAVVVENIKRPFAPDSKQMFLAVGVKDNDAISDGITAMSPMLGFQPRDFLGNQIWESEAGAAIGLGFNRLFAGPSAQVEDAMRQAGQAGAAGLADDEGFRKATATLRGGGMLYSYQNTRDTYEYALWLAANIKSILRAQLEEMEFDNETIEMIIEEQTAGNPFNDIGLPPADLIFRHSGETTVLEAHATDDGFRGRSLTFPADEN